MAMSLGEALGMLGEFSGLLIAIVAVHAAVQVRKYQDAFPQSGLLSVVRGVLATVWFGVGSALAQGAILREPVESLALPVGACVAAYLAVSYCHSDLVYRTAQVPAVNALLILGLEVCRALCVGAGVSSALKVYSGNTVAAAGLGMLRGAWGWAFGRPGAKIILGQPIRETSWPTPPVSTPASTVAAVLLALAATRADAEKVVGALIAVLVAWRSLELYQQA